MLALDKSRGSKSAEVQSALEIYDDRLQFMSGLDALSLDESLDAGNVSRAWLVSDRGRIMGRGTARMRVVRLGGPEVRKARKNAADSHEGGDVFMYRDSSAGSPA